MTDTCRRLFIQQATPVISLAAGMHFLEPKRSIASCQYKQYAFVLPSLSSARCCTAALVRAVACTSQPRSDSLLRAAARLGARAAAARRRLLAPQRSPSSCPPCSGRRHRGGGAPPAAAAALSPPAEAPPPPTSPPPSAREPHLRAQVEALFAAALRAAFPDESASWSLAPAVAPCANPAHGDYQCNTPLPLFARLKAERPGAAASPRDVAARLLAALPPSPLVEAARRVLLLLTTLASSAIHAHLSPAASRARAL